MEVTLSFFLSKRSGEQLRKEENPSVKLVDRK
jgi:hypothetical protein